MSIEIEVEIGNISESRKKALDSTEETIDRMRDRIKTIEYALSHLWHRLDEDGIERLREEAEELRAAENVLIEVLNKYR